MATLTQCDRCKEHNGGSPFSPMHPWSKVAIPPTAGSTQFPTDRREYDICQSCYHALVRFMAEKPARPA